jgi:hypothetical protein
MPPSVGRVVPQLCSIIVQIGRLLASCTLAPSGALVHEDVLHASAIESFAIKYASSTGLWVRKVHALYAETIFSKIAAIDS